jgi:hypothetical protein
VDFPEPTLPIIETNSPFIIFNLSIVKAYLFFYGLGTITSPSEDGSKLSLKLP